MRLFSCLVRRPWRAMGPDWRAPLPALLVPIDDAVRDDFALLSPGAEASHEGIEKLLVRLERLHRTNPDPATRRLGHFASKAAVRKVTHR
jgi:hypothetical protein